MALFSDIISQARVLLQDSVLPYRYTDDELMVGANDAVKIVRKLRPDIFYGTYKTAIADKTLSDLFPIGEEYKMAVRDYVVAHAQLRDTEDAANSRAAMFMELFKQGVMAL
jgi:hypothetical protein